MSLDSSEEDNPLPIWIDGDSLAPYQGSKPETVAAVIGIAEITPRDVVYDLGCGDARIPIAASQTYGCKSVGIEMFVFDKAEARLKAEIQNEANSGSRRIADLVSIRKEDALTCNMSDCTVCIMFLLPEGLKQLEPRLEALLDRGVRLVTIYFGLKTRKPMKTTDVDTTRIYYYTKDSQKV
jgi:hypothetical protein